MSWFKKIINRGSSDIVSDEVIDPFSHSSERNQEYMASINATQELSEMEAIQEERKKKEQAQEDQLIVIHGAKIKMGAHLGEFKVLNNVPTTQDKLTGTIVEKQILNFTFYDGFQMLSLTEWQDFGTVNVQDNFALLKKSTLPGTGKMQGNVPPESGKIEFLDSGQVNVPESITTTGAPVPDSEDLDFDIKLKLDKDDFVPFGIPDYSKNPENDRIKFKIVISGKGVNHWHLKIEHKGSLYFELFASTIEIDEVILKGKVKEPNDNSKYSEVQDFEETERFWPAGEYLVSWDGFDINDIYDSKIMTSEDGFNISIMGQANHLQKSYAIENNVKFDYKIVDWVDVKIDKKNKRIDTTLRVNLKDGGEQGLSCSSTTIHKADYEEASQRLGVNNPIKDSTITFCDWDKVSKEAINFYKKEPIKQRNKSFIKLRDLALKGINEFWSRNSTNVGKGVDINGILFETFVDAIQDEKGMAAPNIIYFTNSEETDFTRSHNWELHRELYYYEGYTYHSDWKSYEKNKIVYVTKGWIYRNDKDINFKETSAHEIGHQLLFEYGGRDNSYLHKGTSGPYWFQQDPLPGTKYPKEGKEIDLMKYAEESEPDDYFERVILSQEDSLGLIWFTKIKIE